MKPIVNQPIHALVGEETSMAVTKQKKSKTERNFELEADLKLAREENALLRKELEGLKNGRAPSLEPHPASIGKEETKKMQGAFQAMKSLLISQEENLHSLRAEVLQSRNRVREQDHLLEYFKKQLAAYKNTEKTHTAAKSTDQALGEKVERLEHAFNRERGKTAKLQEQVKEKNKAIESLRARLEKKMAQRQLSECSMISRKASGTSTQTRRSRDLCVVRRNSSSGSMMDVKSLTSKRTATTATTSSSFPSKSSPSERRLDDGIHGVRSEENRGKISRKPSIRRKDSKRKIVPSTASSSSSKSGCAQGGSFKSDEKKKVVARRKSDLSMIRKASSFKGSMDADSTSMASRRTARSASSRSRYSAGSSLAVRMDAYQAIQKGRGEKRREFNGLFESNGAAPFSEIEGEDNHSIKDNPQGSCNEVFKDDDIRSEENRGEISRKPSIRRKDSKRIMVPSTASSSSSKSGCAQVGFSKSDEKKKAVARRKSDLSMIRKASSCKGSMDADRTSIAIRRTARSISSRSRNSTGSSDAVGMDAYQATQKGREEKRREFNGLFESNGAASFSEIEGEDNHSIKEVAWNPQGSCNEVFEDNDISDTDFW